MIENFASDRPKEAGGHPDFGSHVKLAEPAEPEVAKDLTSTWRRECSATRSDPPNAAPSTLP